MLDKFVTNYGHLPLIGLVLLVVIWVLATWADRAVRKAFTRRNLFEPAIARIVGLSLRIVIIVIASAVLLDEFGIDIATFIAALGIFGFALAIGLRQTMHGFFTGMLVSVLKPYEVGDYIESDRVTGVVEEIHMYHTVVVTADGEFVSVPNGSVWSRSIKNHSRVRPVRVALDITVERQLPFAELAPTIDRILRSEPYCKAEIDPYIVVGDTSENSMTIETAVWCDAEHSWDVQTRLSGTLQEGITAAGVTVTKIEPPKKVTPKKRVVRAPSGDEEA